MTMEMKEKLVEIFCSVLGAEPDFSNAEAMEFVEELIANGVVVQEWISVKDGLPERTGSYIVCTDKGAICTAKFYSDLPTGLRYEKPHWNNSRLNKHITHWCEMPQPPKGE